MSSRTTDLVQLQAHILLLLGALLIFHNVDSVTDGDASCVSIAIILVCDSVSLSAR